MKHIVANTRKKLPVVTESKQKQALWGRIQQAFYTVDPRITRSGMVNLLRQHGADIQERTISGWASGRSWPSFVNIKAIAEVTHTSLDHLVFDSTPEVTAERNIERMLGQIVAVAQGVRKHENIPNGFSDPERNELVLLISRMEHETVKSLLDLARRLSAK